MKYEEVKATILPRLRRNIELACIDADGLAYEMMDDLILTFYVPLDGDDISGSLNIKNTLLDEWGVTKEELIAQSFENASRQINCFTMSSLFGDYPDGSDMLVVSNKSGYLGAGIIASDKVRENLVNLFGGPFLILPSSVHEVICIPDCIDHDEANCMIREINESVLRDEDILSDHAYVCDGHSITSV